jgi:ankyrin repeat protein
MAQNTSEDKEISDSDSRETKKSSESVELIGASNHRLESHLHDEFKKREPYLPKTLESGSDDDYFEFLSTRGRVYEKALEMARPINDTRSEAERKEDERIEEFFVHKVEVDFKTYPKALPPCRRIECWAAGQGLVNIVVALIRQRGAKSLNKGVQPTSMSMGLLALAIAAENNDLTMVKALKNIVGADGHFKILDLDISSKPDLSSSDKKKCRFYNDRTEPLYTLFPDHAFWLCPTEAAARLGRVTMVEELIALSEEIKKKELREEIKKKQLSEELSEATMKKLSEAMKEKSRRALYWAVKMGHHKVVASLIDMDYIVDLNEKFSVYGLLEKADVDSYGMYQSPLALAVLSEHVEVVKVLCDTKKGGLQANVRSGEGKIKNPLQMAFEVQRRKATSGSNDGEHQPFNPKPGDKIVRIIMERDEVQKEVKKLTEERKVHVDAINAILVGTALIATATFAGWLSPPLGYSPGTDGLAFASVQGHPILEKFWVFNSLSFFFSIATFMVGANAAHPPSENDYIGEVVESLRSTLRLAYCLLTVAVAFVVCAFATAGFAVLPPIPKYTVNMAITVGIGVAVVVLSWMSLWKKEFKQLAKQFKGKMKFGPWRDDSADYPRLEPKLA